MDTQIKFINLCILKAIVSCWYKVGS